MSDAPAPTHRRSRLLLLLVPIGLFTIASNVGGYGGPAIVAHHPLLEMFLNPSNRYLALAANRVDATAFYGIGFLRLVITDPLFYLLGLWYGDRALGWVKARSLGSARVLIEHAPDQGDDAPTAPLLPAGPLVVVSRHGGPGSSFTAQNHSLKKVRSVVAARGSFIRRSTSLAYPASVASFPLVAASRRSSRARL